MIITTTKEENFYIMAVEGDLDASSSIILDEAFQKAINDNENKILVDCLKLNYISSAGLGVFMSYLNDFEANNIKMILFNMSDKVKNVFALLGLDELMSIVAAKKEAMEMCK